MSGLLLLCVQLHNFKGGFGRPFAKFEAKQISQIHRDRRDNQNHDSG